MQSVRESWTDERLDDLKGEVGLLREDLRSFRVEMNSRFEAVDGRLDGIQRSMVQLTVAMTASILTGFAGMCALIATQI